MIKVKHTCGGFYFSRTISNMGFYLHFIIGGFLVLDINFVWHRLQKIDNGYFFLTEITYANMIPPRIHK